MITQSILWALLEHVPYKCCLQNKILLDFDISHFSAKQVYDSYRIAFGMVLCRSILRPLFSNEVLLHSATMSLSHEKTWKTLIRTLGRLLEIFRGVWYIFISYVQCTTIISCLYFACISIIVYRSLLRSTTTSVVFLHAIVCCCLSLVIDEWATVVPSPVPCCVSRWVLPFSFCRIGT